MHNLKEISGCLTLKSLFIVISSIVIISSSAYAQQMTLKFPHEAAEHQVGKGQTAIKLAEFVDKYSNGQIKIEVFPAAQLIPTKEEIRAAARGQVQIIAPYTTYISSIDTRFEVFYMPMLYKDRDQALKNFEGPIGQRLLAGLERNGLKGLAIWHDGPIYLFLKDKPAEKLDDVKGKKIRTAPSKPLEEGLRLLGAFPVSLPGPEVFLGLQQGVISGVLTTPTFALTSRWDEVLKGMTKVLMGWGGYALCMNPKTWDSMTPDQQKAFSKAVTDATKWNKENAMAYVDKCEAELKSKGVSIISLSNEESKRWTQILEPVYKQQDDSTQELIQEILNKN
jgi:tripartite ATP-independent transporter DctP family solute receptor